MLPLCVYTRWAAHWGATLGGVASRSAAQSTLLNLPQKLCPFNTHAITPHLHWGNAICFLMVVFARFKSFKFFACVSRWWHKLNLCWHKQFPMSPAADDIDGCASWGGFTIWGNHQTWTVPSTSNSSSIGGALVYAFSQHKQISANVRIKLTKLQNVFYLFAREHENRGVYCFIFDTLVESTIVFSLKV